MSACDKLIRYLIFITMLYFACGESSGPVEVTVIYPDGGIEVTYPDTGDIISPAVSLVLPADGSKVPQDNVTLMAMATDNVGVAEVEFFIDGALIGQGEETSSLYSITWDASSLTEGITHTILALAKDDAGNVGYSETISVTVGSTASADTSPPTVSLVSPADGSIVPRDEVTLMAMATDNVGVTQVEFFVDGVSNGTVSSSPYSIFWNASSFSAGSMHTILAVAKDAADNVGYSETITVIAGTLLNGGIWRDMITGLIWQIEPPEDSMTWDEAIDYCEGLNVGCGGCGWRLPSISELRSLILGCPATRTGGSCGVTDWCTVTGITCNYGPCIGCDINAGPDGGCYWPSVMSGTCAGYWSSSVVADRSDLAWSIYFNAGFVLYFGQWGDLSVRCVR